MIKAIVTDIEGTTSSLSFVKEVLFPYSRQHVADFVRGHAAQPDVKKILTDAEQLLGKKTDIDGLIDQFISWIDLDQKITPLKSLQGLIWEHGYQTGDFKGHLYEDAHQCLTAWKELGISLYVYSSGSVYAQKLLFGHTEYGDLTALFSGYFDTQIGGKKERDSYLAIADQIGLPAIDILFLSDIKEELDAAKAAGYKTTWLIRDGDADPDSDHLIARDFFEIKLPDYFEPSANLI
ncbi:acireductone synthase [Methylicorpusculum oleiharenae]|uniref:acireductone synthase n=1 Tax=Methylicorpusculum oleiharenae TaxID=1338687 RepID=UPI0013577EF5|nr:acireductone synthase [Methylicorpusculum oleiharenae]MCD2451376.1 acireductone synthase [Methylicorpusculum oleiharenae]